MPECDKCGFGPAPFLRYFGDGKSVSECVFCNAADGLEYELQRQREVMRDSIAAGDIMKECARRLREAGIVPDNMFMMTWDVHIVIRDHAKALRATALLGDLLVKSNSWDRRQNGDTSPDMVYHGRLKGTESSNIKIMGVPPPDTCRVVVEEVEVPARKVKRYKVVCGDENVTKEEPAHA